MKISFCLNIKIMENYANKGLKPNNNITETVLRT